MTMTTQAGSRTAGDVPDAAALAALDWGKSGGLLPAVVQDAASRAVLMVGYMSPESLAATLATGRVVFHSRSRGRLWVKGETSGHFLELKSLRIDCDSDCLLLQVRPQGPTCHTGAVTCFGGDTELSWDVLGQLSQTIRDRAAGADAGSYTHRLLAAGTTRIAQKVGEEGVEVALAAVTGSDQELASEAADLLYHLLVLFQARGIDPRAVLGVLKDRQR